MASAALPYQKLEENFSYIDPLSTFRFESYKSPSTGIPYNLTEDAAAALASIQAYIANTLPAQQALFDQAPGAEAVLKKQMDQLLRFISLDSPDYYLSTEKFGCRDPYQGYWHAVVHVKCRSEEHKDLILKVGELFQLSQTNTLFPTSTPLFFHLIKDRSSWWVSFSIYAISPDHLYKPAVDKAKELWEKIAKAYPPNPAWDLAQYKGKWKITWQGEECGPPGCCIM